MFQCIKEEDESQESWGEIPDANWYKFYKEQHHKGNRQDGQLNRRDGWRRKEWDRSILQWIRRDGLRAENPILH